MSTQSPAKLYRGTMPIVFAFASFLSVVAIGIAARESEAAGVRKSCGEVLKTEVAESSAPQTTHSTSFVNIVGAGVSFVQGATSADCVLASFTAQVLLSGAGNIDVMEVRALIDGVPSNDGAVQFAAAGLLSAEARSYNFVFPAVSPGSHILRVQYLTQNGNFAANIEGFDLTIRHP